MNAMKEAILMLLNESKKSKAIKVSLSTLVIIIIAVFVFGKNFFIYKSRMDDIPNIQKDVRDIPKMKTEIEECKKLTGFIPYMQKDIEWLVKKADGVPARESERRGRIR
jgi:hypothetical protein